jgi:hypothetical protein
MMNGDSPSSRTEAQAGTVAFLLDARDDFEATLLRDWVESGNPRDEVLSRHLFLGTIRYRLADDRSESW